MSPRFLLAMASLTAFGWAGMALAQTPAPTPAAPPAAQASVREACMSSIMSLCPSEALSGDRTAVRACLIKNLDKTSPDCQAAVKAVAQSMQH